VEKRRRAAALQERHREESVDGEDDFAELLGFFEVVVGGGALVEGPDFVHDRNEAALGNELEDDAEFVPGAHVGAEDGKLAIEEEANVEFGVRASGGTAGDETSGGGKAFDAFAPGGFADVFEDDVDAAIVGETANFLGDGHDAVMNDFVGTELFGFGEFFIVSGGGNHAAAKEFGDLNSGSAYTAAGGEDEDFFARLELRAIDEHVPGGLEDDGNSRGMGPIEVFWIGKAIDFGTADKFSTAAIHHAAKIGVVAAEIVIAGKAGGTSAAGDAGGEHNFLADVHGAHFGADFGDFAGNVGAGDVGQGNLKAGKPTADPEVEMIEGAGANTDEDFVTAKLRLRNIGEAENGRVTVFLEDDGFHERPPRSEIRCRLTKDRCIVSR